MNKAKVWRRNLTRRKSFAGKRTKYAKYKQKAWWQYKTRKHRINWDRHKLHTVVKTPDYLTTPSAVGITNILGYHLTQIPLGYTVAGNLENRKGCAVYHKKLRGVARIAYEASTYSSVTTQMPIYVRMIMIQVNEHIAQGTAINLGQILDIESDIYANLTGDADRIALPYTYNQVFKFTVLYDKTVVIQPKTPLMDNQEIYIKVKPKRRIKKTVYKREVATGSHNEIEKGSIWFFEWASRYDNAAPTRKALSSWWFRDTFGSST